jgi:hypothetical protein
MEERVSLQGQVPATRQRTIETQNHKLYNKFIKREQSILQISSNNMNNTIKHQGMLGTT